MLKKITMMLIGATVFISLMLAGNRSFAQSFMSFPFEVDSLNGYIMVQLSVNESEPRWFILDTGASQGVVLSWDTAKQLSLKYDESEKLSILFGLSQSEIRAYPLDKSISVRLSTKAERMSGFTFGLRKLAVLPKEINLPICLVDKKFVKAAGIVSLEAFGNMIVRICYDTQTLTISNTLDREGWIDVSSTQHDENKIYIRLSIGGYTLNAFLDSGVPCEIALNKELQERFRGNLHLTLGNPSPSFTAYDALSLPEVALGTFGIRLFRVMTHEYNQPTIWGAQGMLYFNWQFDWQNKRVYVQPRKNLPMFHCNYFAAMFMEVEHRDGKYTIVTAPGSYLHRLLPRPCELLAVEGMPLQELQKMLQDPQEEIAGFVKFLLLSPLKQEVRLKVRCGDDTREITVRSPLSARQFHELLAYFSSQQLGFKTETDENGGITLWFSPNAPVRYLVEGQPADVDNEYRLHLWRIVGLDIEQPTLEELFLHLHSHLLQGKSVQLVCKDEQKREVLVEIPAAEPPKAEDTPSPVPPKETRDE